MLGGEPIQPKAQNSSNVQASNTFKLNGKTLTILMSIIIRHEGLTNLCHLPMWTAIMGPMHWKHILGDVPVQILVLCAQSTLELKVSTERKLITEGRGSQTIIIICAHEPGELARKHKMEILWGYDNRPTEVRTTSVIKGFAGHDPPGPPPPCCPTHQSEQNMKPSL